MPLGMACGGPVLAPLATLHALPPGVACLGPDAPPCQLSCDLAAHLAHPQPVQFMNLRARDDYIGFLGFRPEMTTFGSNQESHTTGYASCTLVSGIKQCTMYSRSHYNNLCFGSMVGLPDWKEHQLLRYIGGFNLKQSHMKCLVARGSSLNSTPHRFHGMHMMNATFAVTACYCVIQCLHWRAVMSMVCIHLHLTACM